MIDIRSTLYRLGTRMIDIRSTLFRLHTRGTLNDRYKVYTLLTRLVDFIPGGTLNDRYKVYTLQTRDFIPGEL